MQSVNDRPGPASIMCLIDMGMHVVEPDAIDGSIGRESIGMTCVDEGDLCPVGDAGWSNILPGLAAIAGDMDETVIGTCPDGQRIYR